MYTRARMPEKTRKIRTEPPPLAAFSIEEVKELLSFIHRTEVTHIAWTRGHEKVVVRRDGADQKPRSSVHPAPPTLSPPTASTSRPEPVAAHSQSSPGTLITSPFVGIFYRAPSPDAPPFAEAGQKVRKGQVLCIIEAMKLMNEIESEEDGLVAEVFATNGHPVEFGQKLFRIVPD
jgi:acetyl-CoA carboxylase biotin carboxyl carrier protein